VHFTDDQSFCHRIERLVEERATLTTDRDTLRARAIELQAQLDAACATVSSECVEHVELNGHIDLAEQCCDWINHEAMDSGDPGGKLQDFASALRIVIDQCDRQRRRANWHEAGYKAGKTKLIEYAVAKEVEAIAAYINDHYVGRDDDPHVIAGDIEADIRSGAYRTTRDGESK
jgi:hypothetical protein